VGLLIAGTTLASSYMGNQISNHDILRDINDLKTFQAKIEKRHDDEDKGVAGAVFWRKTMTQRLNNMSANQIMIMKRLGIQPVPYDPISDAQ